MTKNLALSLLTFATVACATTVSFAGLDPLFQYNAQNPKAKAAKQIESEFRQKIQAVSDELLGLAKLVLSNPTPAISVLSFEINPEKDCVFVSKQPASVTRNFDKSGTEHVYRCAYRATLSSGRVLEGSESAGLFQDN